ncbi:MAG: glycosyltransferase [Sulfurimonas sp.]|nr:glycosyltransferase [Sulfurimonas sp.]MBU1217822.1 glycosyltransferase [bacterium]MBU1433379.1 glycosyltransferase [bacterium]MBU1503425.1 glycosyltransferase [bacterium]MBU3940291.1 glycosyltransferase [bacterium]
MKITIIISVYKDVPALDLIIHSLLNQTHEVDEIIISEDGNSQEMSEYSASLKNAKIKHLSQEDKGWQKNRALNRAIAASTGDYLIFIDGDCIPYPTFIESHKLLAQKNAVLCGRRSEPGEKFSHLLRTKELSVKDFVSNYISNYFQLKNDGIRHYDDGIYLHPSSSLLKLIKKFRKKENHIVGCNFSCWKSDMEKINGFDEDFLMPTTGEDTDIERRMRHFGIKMNSCRYSANVIHLYHKKIFNNEISTQTKALMENKKDIFVCKNGLKKEEI